MLQLIIPDSDELWDEKKKSSYTEKAKPFSWSTLLFHLPMGIKMVCSISFEKGQDP